MTEALRPFRLDEERDLGPPEVHIGGQNEDHSNTPIIDDGIGPIIRGESSHTETGYILFLDALGMKRIWEHYSFNQVNMMWKRSIQSFLDSIERYRPYLNVTSHFRVLSDTIMIAIPIALTNLTIGQVFELLLEPFMTSIMNRMLFRGTISYGQYSISHRLLLGPALSEAAYHNDKLNWIGVTLTPELAERLGGSIGFSTPRAKWYDNVPHKELQVYRSVVLNWPPDDTHGGCYQTLVDENSRRSADHLKYENTFAFYGSR